MAVANLSNIVVALEVQSGLGTPASGAGATGLEVRPSTGLRDAVTSIASQMLQRNRMAKRPRKGSSAVSAAYETELQVENLLVPFEGVLGGTWAGELVLDESDMTSCAVSASGATVTFAGGSIITEGARVGMMAKLTNMTEAGNNGVWFPILAISSNGRVITTIAGILTDESADTAFSITFAASLSTDYPYTDRYFSVEEYNADIDRSKLGTDMKFSSLSFAVAPNTPVTVSIGLGGIALDLLATGSSPNFTDPVFTEGASLVPLDGAWYINGVGRGGKITGGTFGLTAPVSTLPVVGSTASPDVHVGQFQFDGSFSVAVEDGTDFDLFDGETQISMFLRFQVQGTDGASFLSLYMGNLLYGGFDTPAGGEGLMTATIPLYGGEDERGTALGYARTTMLISCSEDPT